MCRQLSSYLLLPQVSECCLITSLQEKPLFKTLVDALSDMPYLLIGKNYFYLTKLRITTTTKVSMDLKEKFKSLHPGVLFLEQEVSTQLHQYLQEKAWLQQEEKVEAVEKPGEGNMNFVVRLITQGRSMILKQSRPWVQKFPQVAAPIERIYVEYNFYRFIAPHKNISRYTPAVLGFDPKNYILLLEDLGKGADYTFLYQKGTKLTSEEVHALTSLLSTLHQVKVPSQERRYFDNQAMKELNHEHIFIFPFTKDNGFNLDDVQQGLQQVAVAYKQDEVLKTKILHLGSIYLQNDETLLHGDYYPGSWLKVANGLKLIDPEFSYFGRAEFDLGVMLAHMKMSQHNEADIEQVLELYEAPDGFQKSLMWAFTGVEIMRRIIGLAQLPLSLNLAEKKQLLDESVSLINEYA